MDFIIYFATDIARRIFISEEARRLGFSRVVILDDSAACLFLETQHADASTQRKHVQHIYRHMRRSDSVLDWETPDA
jgi:hypothetical protein